MKRWKRVGLIGLLLLILSQTPFIYRRYKLGRLQATINALNAQRISQKRDDRFVERKGVIHVHSFLGGHSTGTFDEIVAGAKANKLDFVMMTEHPAKHINTAESTLKGEHEGILFINGNEINAADEDRLLIFPGFASVSPQPSSSTQNVIDEAKRDNRLVFIAYPEQLRSWEVKGFDGIEIYNLYTNTKRINYARLFFDALWSYWSYPDLLFSTFYEKPETNLNRWDQLTASQNRKLVAIAGNDAHANVGLSLQHLTGKRILQLKLDPYERSFQVVRMHVLTEKDRAFDTDALLSALKQGHCFISFDLFCDGSGFRFTADNGMEKRIMGDEIDLAGGVRFNIDMPVKSRAVVIRNGEIVNEIRDTERVEFQTNQQGVYRVEVFLDALGQPLRERPWIISNPIYVR